MNEKLESRFLDAWSKLRSDGPRGEPGMILKSLNHLYNSTDRFYHNLEHVEHGLEEIDFIRNRIEYPEEVEMAWFFHDAIYDSRAKDNEERSSWLSHALLAQNGIVADSIFRIDDLILTTKHSFKPEKKDEEYMVDIDLSILGQAPEIFDRYERNIRQEYLWVPQEEFRIRRIDIMQGFLNRTSVYFTDHFIDKYEERARENLERSIENLSAHCYA